MRSVAAGIKRKVGRSVAKVYSSIAGKDLKTSLPHAVLEHEGHHVFFGYYDKQPFRDGRTLAHAVPTGSREDSKIKLGYFQTDVTGPTGAGFTKVAETELWNWQQGSRLMWHPTARESILYNSLEGGRAQTVIQNLSSAEKTRIPFPTYDISSDGKHLLSLDFHELALMRPGYGYPALDAASTPEETKGRILVVEAQTGRIRFSILREQLRDHLPADVPAETGYFNHLSFSPGGKNFVFYFIATAGKKRLTYAFVCDVGTQELRILSQAGFMSHYTWVDDENLIIFTKLRGVPSYVKYRLGPGPTQDVFFEDFTLDGHPTFVEGRLITDCYPQWPTNEQTLYELWPGKGPRVLATFLTPLEFTGDVRCDLHPRVHKLRDGELLLCCDFPSYSSRVRKMALVRARY